MKTKILSSIETIFKFSLISLLSFTIDFFAFILLYKLFGGLFFPLIMARLLSGSFNFWQNKLLVYNAEKSDRIQKEILSYIVLAIVVFCLGYVLISVLVLKLHLKTVLAKFIIDATLFLSSYLFQKYFIFYKKRN